jgi:alpha-L-fucosidase
MVKFIVFLACFCLFLNENIAQLQPNALQKSQIKRGYGMFIHFGINTFNEVEWSKGNLPVSSYNPDKLDCDQWIKTAKEAGFAT